MIKMTYLKNVPEKPMALASLINYKEGMVVSMQMTKSEDFQMMLMAVSDGEEVTSEQYPGDTIYYVLDGTMPLTTKDTTYILHCGECMAMEANTPHAIGGQGPFKILQITLKKD